MERRIDTTKPLKWEVRKLEGAARARNSIAFMEGKLEKGEQVDGRSVTEKMAVIDGWLFKADLPAEDFWKPVGLIAELYEKGLLPQQLSKFGAEQSYFWNFQLEHPVEEPRVKPR